MRLLLSEKHNEARRLLLCVKVSISGLERVYPLQCHSKKQLSKRCFF